MLLRIRVPLRHPFYPDWAATPAREAANECSVLSGTYAELMDAAAAGGVRPTHAVFVLLRPSSPFLSEQERDALWAAFQVPVMALLLDRRGSLAAWECEAQSGMHVGGAWTPQEIWAYRLLTSVAELDNTPCECGRPGDRLKPVRKREPGRETSRPAFAPAAARIAG